MSTDSSLIAEIGEKYDSIHIDRPKSLALPDSFTEDVITHAYDILDQILMKRYRFSIIIIL